MADFKMHHATPQRSGCITCKYETNDVFSSSPGALFGGMLGGAAMRQGRRKALLFISLPLSMCWLLTMCADSVKMLLATSLVAGFLCAIVSMVSQVNNADLSLFSRREFSRVKRLQGLGTSSLLYCALVAWILMVCLAS